jgi:hypothetical protein
MTTPEQRPVHELRNRRKLPRVLIGTYVVCFLGSWALTSVGGYPIWGAAITAVFFFAIVFPLVWYVVKE